MCAGLSTTLAPASYVNLVYSVASYMGVDVTLPLLIQFLFEGQWMDLCFQDQMAIASLLCELIASDGRNAVVECSVWGGKMICTLHVLDGKIDVWAVMRIGGEMQVRVVLNCNLFANSSLSFVSSVVA